MAFPPRGRIDPQTLAAWKSRQEQLHRQAVIVPLRPLPRFVAGVDCAFAGSGDEVLAVALVWDCRESTVVAQRGIVRPVEVPYIPGYLSFREGPAVHAALDALTHPFDAILFDGQGFAHPRRCGLATHVGVERNVPSVGCAKSRLIGAHDEPGPETGDTAELRDKGELVGRVLRTRPRVRPLFVSVGHRCDLGSAVALVLACRTKYRLPEPTRLADAAVARLKLGEDVSIG